MNDRLQLAADTGGYELYLECQLSSATDRFFCTSIGTDSLDTLAEHNGGEASYVDKVRALNRVYSCFKPHRRKVGDRSQRMHPGRDVRELRTHTKSPLAEEADYVVETVTVEADDLFTQLPTSFSLAKSGLRGLLFILQEVAEGTIRVWRDWLAEQCESRSRIIHDTVPNVKYGASASASKHASANIGGSNVIDDPDILWIHRGDKILGIKFRVRDPEWRRATTPSRYISDIDTAASYELEFQGRL